MLRCLRPGYCGLVRTRAFSRALKVHRWFSSDVSYVHPKVFRRYEDGYVVREMTPADARIVQNWYCAISKQSPYDLTVAMSVSPPGAGFYIGEKDGVAIASLVYVPWGKNLVYTSYLYVAELYRQAGYGERLIKEGNQEYAQENIIVVDTMSKTVTENNRKNGYESAFKTVRYQGVAQDTRGAVYKNCNIVKVSDIPFDEIIDYDNRCFMQPDCPKRRAFLERWLAIPDGVSSVALDSSGQVVGYGQRRPCFQEKNHVIGPLYADNPKIAKALLQSLCTGVTGENVTINVWMPNEAALEMVDEFKMAEVFTAERMHLNGDPKEYRETTYGVTSLGVCGF